MIRDTVRARCCGVNGLIITVYRCCSSAFITDPLGNFLVRHLSRDLLQCSAIIQAGPLCSYHPGVSAPCKPSAEVTGRESCDPIFGRFPVLPSQSRQESTVCAVVLGAQRPHTSVPYNSPSKIPQVTYVPPLRVILSQVLILADDLV